MKILIICPEYPPNIIGGGGIVYKALADKLSEKGHKSRVIAGNFTNQKIIGDIEELSYGKVNVRFVPLLYSRKVMEFDPTTYTLPTIKGLVFLFKQLIASKDEVIHLHGFFHPIIDLSAIICLLLRKKYIMTCHGIPKTPQYRGYPIKLAFKFYSWIIEKTIVRKAEFLTTVSRHLLRECYEKKLTNENMTVIYNGINVIQKKINMDLVENLQNVYRLKGKRLIFSIGRLNKTKGFQYLIGAIPNIVEKNPMAMAIIAGIGPFKRALNELVIENNLVKNIKFLGWISDEEKDAFFHLSDVVVFPSIDEPFGLVILEAFEKNKPVIAFKTGSSSELIENEIDGLIVPLGDEKRLAETITRLLDDGALAKNISNNAKLKLKIFDWNKIVREYLIVYRKAYSPIRGN